MHKERLLRLATHLETVVALQPATFDMDTFGTEMPCGTVCCALGHATAIPEFRAAGLRMDWHDVHGLGDERQGNVCIDYRGEEWSGIDAGQLFFDIEEHQACVLFGPNAPHQPKLTPLDVAARIRALVAAN